jgi:hypothetical protein
MLRRCVVSIAASLVRLGGQGMNIERLSLESLKPHPLNAKIYGAAEPDQALIQSIEAVGVLNAIIVDQKGRILSGTRRWKACKALAERHGNEKFSQIPTEVFKGNELEAQRRLIPPYFAFQP